MRGLWVEGTSCVYIYLLLLIIGLTKKAACMQEGLHTHLVLHKLQTAWTLFMLCLQSAGTPDLAVQTYFPSQQHALTIPSFPCRVWPLMSHNFIPPRFP